MHWSAGADGLGMPVIVHSPSAAMLGGLNMWKNVPQTLNPKWKNVQID